MRPPSVAHRPRTRRFRVSYRGWGFGLVPTLCRGSRPGQREDLGRSRLARGKRGRPTALRVRPGQGCDIPPCPSSRACGTLIVRTLRRALRFRELASKRDCGGLCDSCIDAVVLSSSVACVLDFISGSGVGQLATAWDCTIRGLDPLCPKARDFNIQLYMSMPSQGEHWRMHRLTLARTAISSSCSS